MTVGASDTVRAFTGVALENRALGGAALHGQRSGVASLVVDDEDDARLAVAHVLDFLPSNHLADPPRVATDDPVDRSSGRAAAVCERWRPGPRRPTPCRRPESVPVEQRCRERWRPCRTVAARWHLPNAAR